MARRRIRSLKPEFFGDEKVIALTRDARLVLIGLITLADDRGRLRDRPLEIVGALFPEEEVTVEMLRAWLDEIVGPGLALRYEIGGHAYLWLPQFMRHQVVDKPNESELPPHPEDKLARTDIRDAYKRAKVTKGNPGAKKTRRVLDENSPKTRRVLGEESRPTRGSVPFPSLPIPSVPISQQPMSRALIDEASSLLRTRWEDVDEIGVENAAAMYPTIDLLQGCRLAITWAGDPSWEIESCAATLRAALRKLDQEAKAAPRAASDPEKNDAYDARIEAMPA